MKSMVCCAFGKICSDIPGVCIVLQMILVVALYFIGNRQNLLGSNIRLYAEFSNVNGLQAGNNVRYSGINIGTVKSIDMMNDSTITVNMNIDEKIENLNH